MEKKYLTVKTLIEELSKYDGDLPIMIYSEMDEGGGIADSVSIETKDKKHGCQADHPFDFSPNGIKEAICISGGNRAY